MKLIGPLAYCVDPYMVRWWASFLSLAVFALLAGTATTFSVATPLMATIISELFHVAVSRTVINIIILLITCAVYTYSLLHGFKGISKLANICIYSAVGRIPNDATQEVSPKRDGGGFP